MHEDVPTPIRPMGDPFDFSVAKFGEEVSNELLEVST